MGAEYKSSVELAARAGELEMGEVLRKLPAGGLAGGDRENWESGEWYVGGELADGWDGSTENPAGTEMSL